MDHLGGGTVDTFFTENSLAVWKGIEYGFELVKKGMIWQVENGTSIRTWRDPCIPRGPNFRPITPKRQCRFDRLAVLSMSMGCGVRIFLERTSDQPMSM